MAKLSISLFGDISIALNEEPVLFPTDKTMALFVYLVVEAGKVHRREALAGYLWPDQPQENALQNLRQALTQLRRALQDYDDRSSFLLLDRQTACFNPDSAYWMDVAEYRRLHEECKAHRHRQPDKCLPCCKRIQKMVALYRGDFLAQYHASDSNFLNDWIVLIRESLHRPVVDGLEVLTTVAERQRDIQRALEYAWQMVALYPWHEAAHVRLMRLLAVAGQRGGALAQYERCRAVLANELGVEPMRETTRLYEQIKQGLDSLSDFQEKGSPFGAAAQRLPSTPANFVGRERELADLANLIADPDQKLITVIGPGGVGKSRLALELAVQHAGLFVDGVAFVSLADVDSLAAFLPALAAQMQIEMVQNHDFRQQVHYFLCDKEMLIVLDNMDHLLESLDDLIELLSLAPNLVFLVTSRERLRLKEEWVYPLAGLEVPPPAVGAAEQSTYNSVRLFERRAVQAHAAFKLLDDLDAVGRICRLVEGFPLAIELSAAWVGLYPCGKIADYLQQNLTDLETPLRNAPDRHASVRAAFEASWTKLSGEEREVYARLSVFQGGFNTMMAFEVCGATALHLNVLADKSLLRDSGAQRYAWHELLRQFAAEKLELDPALGKCTRELHARAFTFWIVQQTNSLPKGDQQALLQEVRLDLENLHAAWLWLVDHHYPDLLDACMDGLYAFHSLLGRFEEVVNLYEPANELWLEKTECRALWAKLRSHQAAFLQRLGRYEHASEALQAACAASIELGDATLERFCLLQMAYIARAQGEPERMRELATRVLELASPDGLSADAARAYFLLGAIQNRAGSPEKARQHLLEGLRIAEQLENNGLRLMLLNALGDAACYTGDFAEAQRLFGACLQISEQMGDLFNTAIHLNNLGTVYHELGQLAEAARLYEQSLQACRAMGDRPGEAIALSNLGEVALISGQYARAKEYFLEGLALSELMGDTFAAVACLNNLGQVNGLAGETKQARKKLLEALSLAVGSQSWAQVAAILLNAAELLLRDGQQQQAAALLKLLASNPRGEKAKQARAALLFEQIQIDPPTAPQTLEEAADRLVQEWMAQRT